MSGGGKALLGGGAIGIVILFIYLFLCLSGKWENVNLVVISIFIIITSLKEIKIEPKIGFQINNKKLSSSLSNTQNNYPVFLNQI